MFLLIINLTGAPALVVSIGFMLLVFGQIPINDALLARIIKSEWRSRVYGLKYILTFTISATTIPMIALLHTSGGFAALFTVAAVVAVVMFVSVLMLPRTATAPLPAGAD